MTEDVDVSVVTKVLSTFQHLIEWHRPHSWWILGLLMCVSLTWTKGDLREWLIVPYRQLHLTFCYLNAARIDWWLWSPFGCFLVALQFVFFDYISTDSLFRMASILWKPHKWRTWFHTLKSERNENCPSVGPCITKQPQTGTWEEKKKKKSLQPECFEQSVSLY